LSPLIRDVRGIYHAHHESMVTNMWQCTASCCTSKGRWYGRKDEFTVHQNRHAGGNETLVKSGNSAKNGMLLGYRSLCTSAPMTLMDQWHMRRHLTLTFGQVLPIVGQ